jgi:hypothetical protein
MTDPADGTLDDRLARLAARRSAGAKPSTSVEGTHAERPKPVDQRKRLHAAATGRLVAAWITSSAFLGIVAALGLQSQAATAKATTIASAAPPRARTAATGHPGTTKPKVVVKVRHHTVYVDTSGKTIATTGAHATATPPSGSTLIVPAPLNTAAPSPAPVVTAAPSPGSVAAPPPAPVSTPHPTTHVTAPPATSAATSPPTTAFKPPPPPPPPPCTGSKCP